MKEVSNMGIGDRIRTKRIELGLSQEELAKKTGYTSRAAINKIEKGVNDITQSKVKVFAEALNTTPAYLMDWQIKESLYGDHAANLEYFANDPDLLETYKHIVENDNLKLLFDSAKDLSPEDLEPVLILIDGIRKQKCLK